ncbi:unnamed protein product [Lymnaea stagnalis]|uniref:TLC domain-containing protein n=1 Tax=Lymnaea stagnalis TaxID=6523 RepID=A0AAV2HCY6_LYMST
MAQTDQVISQIQVIESEEILQHFHPGLLKLDYADRNIKAYIIAGTFLFVSAIFSGSLLFCNLFKAFRGLILKHQVFMSLAIVRGAYGIFGIFIGCYAIFRSTVLDRDIVFGKNATSSFAMCVTVGFFIFELSAVLLSDVAFKTFSKMLIMHHGLALVAFSLAINSGSNYSFGCKGMILEMSTPFSCLCYVFLKAGMENSTIWKINQFVLIHTFHLRSVVECHLWYVTYKHWDDIYSKMSTPIFALLYTNLVLVTFVMTPYWGYKKTEQLFNPVDWNFQESRDTDTLSPKRKAQKAE